MDSTPNACALEKCYRDMFSSFDFKMLGMKCIPDIFYNFNVSGYLPYFVPNMAAYGKFIKTQ